MATRSPLATPCRVRAEARRFTRELISAYVRALPSWKTMARRSGKRSALRRIQSPARRMGRFTSVLRWVGREVREGGVGGKSGAVLVEHGGSRSIKKKRGRKETTNSA